jgi:hypothetical protein
MNLLAETIEWITRTKHTPADIVYIGSRDGYSCTWDEFTRLADIEYDNGYGGQRVATDLEIHFRDGGWMQRGEYDGSEWWDCHAPFVMPTETKPIRRLVEDFDHCCAYDGLAGLHEDVDA